MNPQTIVNKLGKGILSAGSGKIHQERLNEIAVGIQSLSENKEVKTIEVKIPKKINSADL